MGLIQVARFFSSLVLIKRTKVDSTLAIVHGEHAAHEFSSNLDDDYTGVIWLSTTLPRSYLRTDGFPFKSASVVGDLDGHERVTRLGKSVFQAFLDAKLTSDQPRSSITPTTT